MFFWYFDTILQLFPELGIVVFSFFSLLLKSLKFSRENNLPVLSQEIMQAHFT